MLAIFAFPSPKHSGTTLFKRNGTFGFGKSFVQLLSLLIWNLAVVKLKGDGYMIFANVFSQETVDFCLGC